MFVCLFVCLSVQLNETKSSNPRLTLLNYVAEFVERKYPDAVNFHEQIAHVGEAARGMFMFIVLLYCYICIVICFIYTVSNFHCVQL